jgi:hypothetical protein
MELIFVSSRSCLGMLTSQRPKYIPTWIREGSKQSIGDFIPVADNPSPRKPWTYSAAFDYRSLNE